jgi:hypothetical protein
MQWRTGPLLTFKFHHEEKPSLIILYSYGIINIQLRTCRVDTAAETPTYYCTFRFGFVWPQLQPPMRRVCLLHMETRAAQSVLHTKSQQLTPPSHTHVLDTQLCFVAACSIHIPTWVPTRLPTELRRHAGTLLLWFKEKNKADGRSVIN